MNVQRLTVTLITAIALVSLTVGCTFPADRPGSDSSQSGGSAVAQGYPPPGGTLLPPTPTATPSSDPDGYFPPPVGRTDRIESIAESPHSELLAALQSSFSGGSSTYLVERVTDRFGVALYDVDHLDSEGGTSLDAPLAETALDGFFDAGSSPLIQGYFESGDAGSPCLVVVAAPFAGSVEHPGAADPDPYGPQPPAHIPADAAGFGMCQDNNGDWLWQQWAYGGYHQIVEKYDDARRESGWQYIVIRP